MDTHGAIGFIILHGDLALRIGAQIGHRRIGLTTDFCQFDEEQMTELEGERHTVVSLAGGIAEHHTLVSSALFFGLLTFHATVDVGTLRMDGREDTARIAIEHILSLGVADSLDGFSHCLAKFHVSLSLDFASQYDLASGN